MKNCTKCEEPKELTEFYKQSRYVGGYTPRCKECTRKIANQTRRNNIERFRFSNYVKSTEGMVEAESQETIIWPIPIGTHDSINQEIHDGDYAIIGFSSSEEEFIRVISWDPDTSKVFIKSAGDSHNYSILPKDLMIVNKDMVDPPTRRQLIQYGDAL